MGPKKNTNKNYSQRSPAALRLADDSPTPSTPPRRNSSQLPLNISNLTSELDEVSSSLKSLKKSDPTYQLMTSLHTLLGNLLSGLDDLQEEVISLKTTSRKLEDIADHHYQRSLKGKFLISPNSSLNSTLSNPGKLVSDGLSLPSYVAKLISDKYGILNVTDKDIHSCHWTRNDRNIIFRLNSLRHGSPCDLLLDCIMSGKGKEVPQYFINFSLSPRRSALLYDLRCLKKENKIFKFYSHPNGSISFQRTESEQRSHICSIYVHEENSNTSHIRTFTRNELHLATTTTPSPVETSPSQNKTEYSS